MSKKKIQEPTTDAGRIADLSKWGIVIESEDGTFEAHNTRTGGRTILDAESFPDALFEAWHLFKP